MRSNRGQCLNIVLVMLLPDKLEIVLPMQCYCRIIILVQKKKS